MSRAAMILVAMLAVGSPAFAQGATHALVISGASGGGEHAERFERWRSALAKVLRDRMRLDAEHLTVLAEKAGAGEQVASRENVRSVLSSYRGKLTADDTLVIVLIGHGTADGSGAKFNLVGPDLSATEWRDLIRGLEARVAVMNTTAASFPFIEQLSASDRIVITATDSVAQRYETVFPEYLVAALNSEESDLDKNGRVSLLEAFTYAATRVGQHYEQLGQLSTERPLLDDNGDGVGREAGAEGTDGALAGRTYFDPPKAAPAGADPALAELFTERARLESEIERLKGSKGEMPSDLYERQMEQLLLDLARVSRRIKEGR